MHPVGGSGNGDIDAVIHEKERIRGATPFTEGNGQVVHLPTTHPLGAELKGGDSPGQGILDQVRKSRPVCSGSATK